MKRLATLTVVILFPLISLSPANAANPLYGHNLIVNGNAEAGSGLPGSGETPGWPVSGVFSTTYNMITVQYGYDGYPSTGSPGPKQRGTNFFSGGTKTSYSSVFQRIDVSSAAGDIDAQTVHYTLSGYLGGYANQADYATLSALFQDASGTSLGSVVIGPVTQQQRKGVTGLWSRSTTGILPVGTRSIAVEMGSKNFEGASNDGYLDNLSFVLTKKKH